MRIIELCVYIFSIIVSINKARETEREWVRKRYFIIFGAFILLHNQWVARFEAKDIWSINRIQFYWEFSLNMEIMISDAFNERDMLL